MINPRAPSRFFPKMNTINFNKVGLIVCEGDCVCVPGGGRGGEGSPKRDYFMIDPWAPSRLFPKMNTISFRKVGVTLCLSGVGGKGGRGKGKGEGGEVTVPRCTFS